MWFMRQSLSKALHIDSTIQAGSRIAVRVSRTHSDPLVSGMTEMTSIRFFANGEEIVVFEMDDEDAQSSWVASLSVFAGTTATIMQPTDIESGAAQRRWRWALDCLKKIDANAKVLDCVAKAQVHRALGTDKEWCIRGAVVQDTLLQRDGPYDTGVYDPKISPVATRGVVLAMVQHGCNGLKESSRGRVILSILQILHRLPRSYVSSSRVRPTWVGASG